MGAQTNNAITALQDLIGVLTTAESGTKTGDPGIDAQTRALLTSPRIGNFVAAILDYGSRGQQNATATTRAAASGLTPSQEAIFTEMTAFIAACNTQIAVLQNPTATPRRQHITLL